MDFYLVFLICVLVEPVFGDNASSKARSCSDVRQFYVGMSFSLNGVPQTELSGEHLRICPQGYTCCTSEMEEKLSNLSRHEVEGRLKEAGWSLQTTLNGQYKSFDGYFLELLNRSEDSLQESFRAHHGPLYTQNARQFQDLYAELRSYYRGSGVNLEDALNDFWARLLERLFKAHNPQVVLSDEYLECAAKQTERLRPFGNTPHDLQLKATHALVAARSFVQGLMVSGEVVRKVSQVSLSPECTRAIMKLKYCPLCRGMAGTKPCSSYCKNVMKGCLANQADLDTEWRNLVDAMLQVAQRFSGPNSVEMFLLSLPSHLSQAMVTMQENAHVFSNKVFQACRNPREDGPSPTRPEEARQPGEPVVEDKTSPTAGQRLEKLVSDASGKLRDMQYYWVQLSSALCNNKQTASPADGERCWNGMTKARYLPEIMGDGLASQINNPEVEIDITKPDMTIRQQIMQLKIMTNRLRTAFNGNDVDFQDSSDDVSGSGSGMCADELCHQGPRAMPRPNTDPPKLNVYPAEKKGVRSTSSQTRPCFALLLLSLATVFLRR